LRILAFAVVAWLFWISLSLFALRWVEPPLTALQLQRRIEGVLPNKGVAARFVPMAELPDCVGKAIVAAEDARFFEHHGIDWIELRKATEQGWEAGGPTRGASTITQQLVKNLFLTTHGSYLRKIAEVPLSVLAELLLSKRRILELYLNVVEWGRGVYGIEAAARYHYGIPAERLSRERAARLAAILPAPLRWRPQRMTESAERILRRMDAAEPLK
jgi:monofunctional biosynthetic peptidoglycan transglycosylase